MAVKRIFLDPSRCIGCRSCVAACRECDTHKGESMIYIDFIERENTVATSPTLCMHCEDPLAPCAQVCPAQAILVSPDGVVHQADETRCIYCRNCVFACPFGVPKFKSRRITCANAICAMTAPARAKGRCAPPSAQRRRSSMARMRNGWRRDGKAGREAGQCLLLWPAAGADAQLCGDDAKKMRRWT